MRKLITLTIGLFLFFSVAAQSWQEIEEGKTLSIQGLDISFITSHIKVVKGQDVYQITASISNNGPDIKHLFSQARYNFLQEPENAWLHFRFTNATGKGLSSRQGYIYPNTFSMMFPYKCDPNAKNDTYDSRIIGIGLNTGQALTNEWRVRVEKGEKPTVMVLLKNY
jgi:hypothetical protein